MSYGLCVSFSRPDWVRCSYAPQGPPMMMNGTGMPTGMPPVSSGRLSNSPNIDSFGIAYDWVPQLLRLLFLRRFLSFVTYIYVSSGHG